MISLRQEGWLHPSLVLVSGSLLKEMSLTPSHAKLRVDLELKEVCVSSQNQEQ